MARDNLGTIILYGGGLVLSYYVLKSWGIISTPCDPSVCTPQCPKGPRYSRGLFGDCVPNYVACGILQEDCCCLSAASQQKTTNNNIDTWEPLSEQELNNIKQTLNNLNNLNIKTSEINPYSDDTFDRRTERGRTGKYGFVGNDKSFL